jgi:lipopolysaccharide biosynthesis glycosyltransferase
MGFQEWYKNGLELSEKHRNFCFGVLLIDCNKWGKENITEKLFTIEKKIENI